MYLMMEEDIGATNQMDERKADQKSNTVVDPESTLVTDFTEPSAQATKSNKAKNLTVHRNGLKDTFEIIPYIAEPRRFKKRSRSRSEKSSRERRGKIKRRKLAPPQNDRLLHGIVLGSFIGAALTEFVLEKLR
ncbi:pheromone-regulated protein PRM3 Ecym_2221 [Eremothecium cymbalariae DBVPG|uniref:Uncharacterized protein n=1 Tax=Eremothecium cymbalariae (strain CBS 270.75 / DBVPG 7215 / KCTC 17166 / NRRL Y-17582) TaxID=931890 RepID=G8JP65_ERECY|nr:Hypothetical protein Ecym_2221 [Eremothecium cymbalariae DBVPG\